MKTIVFTLISLLITACGGASGGSSTSDAATGAPVVSNLHNYALVVSTDDTVGFTFAPGILCGVGTENNPGPQNVVQGTPQTYTITATACDGQVSAMASSNPAFTIDVKFYKDGVQVGSISNLASGNSQDFGTF